VLGVLFGLQHATDSVTMGMAIIVFNLTVAPSVGLSLELAVAAMLLALGVFRIVRLAQERDDEEQVNTGVATGLRRRTLETVGRGQAVRSAAIGLVHGLAGSAAVALLVLSAVESSHVAAAYMLLFDLRTSSA
jgi:hypothetical protein